jgi:nucleoside 2-deoxyribosyltransferase
MKTVYVAGAMSANNLPTVMQNIHRGILLASEALEAGYAPFCPHLDVFYQLLRGTDLNLETQQFYDYSMEILKRMDYILVCSNSSESKGTKAEIAMANRMGKPIFFSVEEMLAYDKYEESDNG